jgi:hypothetical protein
MISDFYYKSAGKVGMSCIYRELRTISKYATYTARLCLL